jgi:hypothetical protein
MRGSGAPPSSFALKWQPSRASGLRLIKIAYLLNNPPHGREMETLKVLITRGRDKTARPSISETLI